MSNKYSNLHRLIEQDKAAYQYFQDLPVYVQEQINEHSSGVNSYESLQDYAENLLRGDD